MQKNTHFASLVIMKFGGTSLGSHERIQQAASLVAEQKNQHPVVVTSAMSQVTNLLISTAEAALHKKRTVVKSNLKTLREKHFAVAKTKFTCEKINELLKELGDLYEGIGMLQELTPRALDFACSFGERMSSWLMTEALQTMGLSAERWDSRTLVRTNNHFGAAEIEWKITEKNIARALVPQVKKSIVPVVTGYIGATAKKETTTLGRGGSDYSASILGVSLNASEIQIWTDVDGMMTCDPRLIPEARLVPQVSFQEAAELAYFGAKVLHPKTIQPAVDKNIPVKILNTMNPKCAGTTIIGTSQKTKGTIKAISLKKKISVINICSSRMLGPHGFMAKIFECFAKHQVSVDVVSTSEVSVSVTVEDGSFHTDFIKELNTFATVRVVPNQTIISVVGEGLKNDYRVEEKIFNTLSHAKISTELISKGASQINLTFVVESTKTEAAIKALHASLFPLY